MKGEISITVHNLAKETSSQRYSLCSSSDGGGSCQGDQSPSLWNGKRIRVELTPQRARKASK